VDHPRGLAGFERTTARGRWPVRDHAAATNGRKPWWPVVEGQLARLAADSGGYGATFRRRNMGSPVLQAETFCGGALKADGRYRLPVAAGVGHLSMISRLVQTFSASEGIQGEYVWTRKREIR